MRSRFNRSGLVAPLFAVALAGCAVSQVVVGRCEPDDTRVIAATVEALGGWPPPPVFEVSIDLDGYANVLRELDSGDVPPPLLRSLVERSHKPVMIDPGTPALFQLASAARPKTRQSIHVSQPGYSPDGGAAIVFAGSACGPPCGQAFVVLLERNAEGWTVTRVVEVERRNS